MEFCLRVKLGEKDPEDNVGLKFPPQEDEVDTIWRIFEYQIPYNYTIKQGENS